jgi:PAS domain S-box-containing protein
MPAGVSYLMRILIVDDHQVVRCGVRRLLEREKELEVCGEAVDGRDAIVKAQELRPDAIVMDISMPNLNGLDATRELTRLLPDVRIVILTQHDSSEMLRQALSSGARAYVVKSAITTDLITALHQVRDGRRPFVPGVFGDRQENMDVQEILQRSAAFEAALRESEERFRLTFEQAAIGIAHVGEDGRWLRVNRKLCEILGYTENELLRLRFQDVTYPADLAADLEQAARLAAREISQYSMEERYLRKDGLLVWCHLTAAPVFSPERKVKYFVRVLEDITARKRAEDALMEKARLLDLSADAIIVRDSADRIIYWSRGASEVYGYTREEALGCVSHDFLETQFPEPLENILKALEAGDGWGGELVHTRKDRSKIITSSRWTVVRDPRGNKASILEANRDVTLSKQMERELAKEIADLKLLQEISAQLIQEETISRLYEKIVDAAVVIMCSEYASLQLLDPRAPDNAELVLLAFRGFNPQAAQFWHRVPADSGSTCAAALRTGKRVIASDVDVCDFIVGTPDLATYRQTGIRAVQSTPLLSRTGRIVGMISTHWRQVHTPSERDLRIFDVLARQAADILERRQSEELFRERGDQLRATADRLEAEVRFRTAQIEQRNKELLERSEQLQTLWNRLVRTQEEERRHIARELHDSVGQHLAALSMTLAAPDNGNSGGGKLEKAAHIVEACIAEVRTIAHLLHPPLLEEAGLASAVEWYVKGFAERSGIEADLNIDQPLGELEKEAELVLFRVLQESLSNIHRHSGSKTVSIRLGTDSRQVRLQVEDRGKGVNGSRSGIGIAGMRERVENLGGRFEMRSNRAGTRVRVILPLAATARSAAAGAPQRSSVAAS